jgi:hypothetical protein
MCIVIRTVLTSVLQDRQPLLLWFSMLYVFANIYVMLVMRCNMGAAWFPGFRACSGFPVVIYLIRSNVRLLAGYRTILYS